MRATRRRQLSGKTVIAALFGELVLILLAAYLYGGTRGWGPGDEGPPSVTMHLQFIPHLAPPARSRGA